MNIFGTTGQQRRAWLDRQGQNALDAIQYYAGPGLNVNAFAQVADMFNPVSDIGRAGTSFQGATAPGVAPLDRLGYLGATATDMASVLAPVAGAAYADDAARWLAQGLANVNLPAKNEGLRLLHGGRPGLTLDDVEIFRDAGASRQGKRGRSYGGFYTAGPEDISYARSYADMTPGGVVYDVQLSPTARLADHAGDITRLSPAQIQNWVEQGVGVVRGRDPRGRTEYVVVDKNAIRSLAPREQDGPGVGGLGIALGSEKQRMAEIESMLAEYGL